MVIPAIYVADTTSGGNPANFAEVRGTPYLQGVLPLRLVNTPTNGGRSTTMVVNTVDGGSDSNSIRAYDNTPGNPPSMAAIGSDASVDFQVQAKSVTGSVKLQSNGTTVLRIDDASNGTDDALFRSGSGIMNMIAEGPDANIDWYLIGKGTTGGVRLQANGLTALRTDNPNSGDSNLLVRPGTAVINLLAESASTNAEIYAAGKGIGGVRLQANGSTVLRVDNPNAMPDDIDVRPGSGTVALIAEGPADPNINIVLDPKGAGSVVVPTMPVTDNSTNAATTAFVKSLGYLTSAPVSSVAGRTGAITLQVADVSGAAPLASPILTGAPKAPTQAAGDTSTDIATDAFVAAAIVAGDGSGVSSFDARTGAISLTAADVTAALGFTPYNASNPSLFIAASGAPVQSVAGRTGAITLGVTDIAGASPLASPALTGSPTAPTQSPGDNSTKLATDAFVAAAVAASTVGVSSFDTRTGAISLTAADVTTALGFTPYNASNPSLFIAASGAPVQSVAGRTGAITLGVTDIAGASPLASPALTGSPTAPTQSPGDSSTKLATDAFVTAAVAASTVGVSSFDTRTGNITLLGADIAGAGGALLASPALSGSPTAPTPALGDSSAEIETTAGVNSLLSGTSAITTTGRATTLSASQYGNGSLLFSGALTSNATITVPNAGRWFVENNTTGAYTLTLTTAAGFGTVVYQGVPAFVIADGTNAISDESAILTAAQLASVLNAAGQITANTATASAAATAAVASATAAANSVLSISPGAPNGVPIMPAAVPTSGDCASWGAGGVLADAGAACGTGGGGGSGVTSFDTRIGAVTLASGDITAAGGALLASPALTGAPTAPTQTGTDNTTKIATDAFVQAALPVAATASVLGTVEPDGTTITNTAGAISVSYGTSANTALQGSSLGAASGAAQLTSGSRLLTSEVPAFSGDASNSAGSLTLTLATVNSNTGACGDASHVGQVTLNGKGLTTACAATAISLTNPVFAGTGSITIPQGTTGQEPDSGNAGEVRWNSTTGRYEFGIGGSWINHVRLSGDTMTGALALPTPSVGDNSTNAATTAYANTLVGGNASVSTTGGSTTLAAAKYGAGVLLFTGALTSNATIIVPNTGKWFAENSTSGAFTLTVKTSAGTGIAVPQGATAPLAADGTNVVLATLPSGQFSYTTAGTYTLVVPSWAKTADVRLVSSGSTGGNGITCASGTASSGGAGGTPGADIQQSGIVVTPADSWTIVVGAAAAAPSAAGMAGNAGNQSSITGTNTTLTAFAPGAPSGGSCSVASASGGSSGMRGAGGNASGATAGIAGSVGGIAGTSGAAGNSIVYTGMAATGGGDALGVAGTAGGAAAFGGGGCGAGGGVTSAPAATAGGNAYVWNSTSTVSGGATAAANGSNGHATTLYANGAGGGASGDATHGGGNGGSGVGYGGCSGGGGSTVTGQTPGTAPASNAGAAFVTFHS